MNTEPPPLPQETVDKRTRDSLSREGEGRGEGDATFRPLHVRQVEPDCLIALTLRPLPRETVDKRNRDSLSREGEGRGEGGASASRA